MRKSKYNITTLLNDDEYIINNLISGAIIILDNNEYFQFLKILENPEKHMNLNLQLYNQMIHENFLVPDYADELKIAKDLHWRAKLNKKTLNLTIIPTFDCNLNCSYCYQKGSDKKVIDEVVALRIYKFIENKIKTVKSLHINWFGGEALLCVDFIEKFATKVINLCNSNNVEYSSSIATNGYLLNEKTVSTLKKIKINQINTTLAGSENYHDSLRYTRDNRTTFKTIINNLKSAKKSFNILVSINVTNTNINDIHNLLDFMKKNNLNENISICFDPVTSFSNNPCEDLCLSIKEFNKAVIEMYNYALKIGLNICDTTKFTQNFVYCGTDCENTFTIDSTGNVYKCCEIYNDDTRIGYIGEYGKIHIEKLSYCSSKDPFNDLICKECNILPYCYGGCNNKRDSGKDFCPVEKEFMEEYLKIYYLKNFN